MPYRPKKLKSTNNPLHLTAVVPEESVNLWKTTSINSILISALKNRKSMAESLCNVTLRHCDQN